jgi:hypothetical protein
MAAAELIEDVEFERGRLIIIDADGAVHRIEAHGEGFVDLGEADELPDDQPLD